MTAETPQSNAPNLRGDIKQLRIAYRDLSRRVGRIEKAVYVMMGIGSATGVTAIYNLINALGGN